MELKKGGKEIDVTEENKDEYVELMANWTMHRRVEVHPNPIPDLGLEPNRTWRRNVRRYAERFTRWFHFRLSLRSTTMNWSSSCVVCLRLT